MISQERVRGAKFHKNALKRKKAETTMQPLPHFSSATPHFLTAASPWIGYYSYPKHIQRYMLTISKNNLECHLQLWYGVTRNPGVGLTPMSFLVRRGLVLYEYVFFSS